MKKTLNTTFYLLFAATAFAQQNTLPTVGNVGIGTTTPTSKLEVKGNVKVEGSITVDGNVNLSNVPLQAQQQLQGLDILFIDHNGDIVRGTPAGLGNVEEHPGDFNLPCIADKPQWRHGTNKLFVLCPDVFVGIHTQTPRTDLDVIGTTFSSKLALGSANPTQMKGLFYLKSNLAATLNDPLFVIENADDKILQLDNNGMLRTREVKLDKQTWPDYVFDKNYRLKPLLEVENYIHKNKHLPNIPSENEVVSQGLNVGEMSHLLLEKIEEITLYMIQQEKRLNEQEAEIKALKQQLLNPKK